MARKLSLIVGGVAICVAIILLINSRSASRGPGSDAIRIAAETSKEFASLPSVSARQEESLVEAFSACHIDAQAMPDEATRRGLHELAAQLISLRSKGDVDEYSAWMRSRGWRMRESVPEWEDLNWWYRLYTGADKPPDASLNDFFRVAFTRSLSRKNGELRPEQVAAPPDGMQCLFGWHSGSSAHILDAFKGLPTQVRWVGSKSVGGRLHWIPPVTLDEIIKRDGSALVSELRFGCKGASGDWYPMRLLAYYDPQTKSWLLFNLFYQNTYAVDTTPEL